MTTEDVNVIVHSKCIEAGAYPSPLKYRGFPKSVCTSVNNVACHGIPGPLELRDGDIVNVDITVSCMLSFVWTVFLLPFGLSFSHKLWYFLRIITRISNYLFIIDHVMGAQKGSRSPGCKLLAQLTAIWETQNPHRCYEVHTLLWGSPLGKRL